MSLSGTLKKFGRTALAALERPASVAPSDLRNFVILQHAAPLGSVLHATPLIPALRAAVPEARIIVAASGFSAEVFRLNPGVDLMLPMPSPVGNPITAGLALREALKLHKPYATLTTSGNERTSIAVASWIAGSSTRVGFTLAPELYTAPLTFDPSRSQIANNLRIIEALGHAPSKMYEPEVFFSDEDASHAVSLLGSTYRPERTLAIFVTQTNVAQAKSWRPDRFVAAAQHLVDSHNADIAFVGTEPERAAIEEIRRGVQGTTWNVAGQTNLRQLAALLSMGDVGLTLDTGTMHVGRAAGLPMAIIAPAWSPPVEWLPLNNPRYIILKNADMDAAPPGYIIDEVSVDEVIASLDRLLREFPRQRA